MLEFWIAMQMGAITRIDGTARRVARLPSHTGISAASETGRR
jgi:hypothetical protein